jgi:hypothetical protein
MIPKLDAFLVEWKNGSEAAKSMFQSLYACLTGLSGVSLEYKGRPGVSYSLRARHDAQKERDLFVLVDIIDDDPEARWLSVCFYADQVTDPEGKGDVVPGGLAGDDACCFDIDNPDAGMEAYIIARLKEACGNAAKG